MIDPVQRTFPYGSEHVIMLQDWLHESWDNLLTAYLGPYPKIVIRVVCLHYSRGSYPGYQPIYPWPVVSLLINGRGLFNCQFFDCPTNKTSHPCEETEQCISMRPPFFGPCNSSAYLPDEFICDGQYARIRLINGAANLPFRFWIDRHNVTIVARDGVETVPSTHQYHDFSENKIIFHY